MFSFIVAFGLTKALTNLAAGPLVSTGTPEELPGRRVGWWAFRCRSCSPRPRPGAGSSRPTCCSASTRASTWSMTVNMKIDLAGPRNRGLAMGLNEAAGYLAVGATALATGYLAAGYGLRPVPELLGVAYAAIGLVLSVVLVRDTAAHVAAEAAGHTPAAAAGAGGGPAFRAVFAETTWRNRSLRGASQAGPGQQPQRRPDLGRVPPAVRPPGPRPGRDRPDQGPVPAGLGGRAADHRPPVRPPRPQAHDRRRDDRAVRRVSRRPHAARPSAGRRDHQRRAARGRHGDGLPGPDRRGRPTLRTRTAGPRASGSTGSGATSATPSARWRPACSPPRSA